MPQVKAKSKSSSSGAMGKLMSISIELVENGFEVTKTHEPTGKNQMWSPPKIKDKMVFTEPGACLSYLEECLGPKEHMAHEKSEEKSGKGPGEKAEYKK